MAVEVSLTLGVGFESITMDDIEYIVSLNENNPNFNVAKPALRFLSHLILLPDALSSCHLGFPIVYKALSNVAERSGGNHPLVHLVAGLSADDLGMSKEALRLINALLLTAPTRAIKEHILLSLGELKYKKGMRRLLTFHDGEVLLECNRFQDLYLSVMEDYQAEAFDTNNSQHEETLLQYWKNVFPKTPLKNRISEEWGELGFQGKDPASDFRGMGMLGLKHLSYISSTHKKQFREIVGQFKKTKAEKQYPLSVAGIQISDLLFQLFEVGKYRKTEKAAGDGAGAGLGSGSGSAVGGGKQKVCKILFDGEDNNIVEEMYSSIFWLLNKLWYEMKLDYMGFPQVFIYHFIYFCFLFVFFFFFLFSFFFFFFFFFLIVPPPFFSLFFFSYLGMGSGARASASRF